MTLNRYSAVTWLSLSALLAAPVSASASPDVAAPEAPAPPVEPEGPSEAPRSALLINPLGPAVALIGGLTARALLGGGGLGLSASLRDVNLRGHHSVTDRVGVSGQLDYSRLDFILQTRHASARLGPRIALGEGGLEAWAITPFALAGYSFLDAGELQLARWATLGAGVEAGRIWTRGRFAFELGAGAYTSANIGYQTSYEDAIGSEAPNGSPIKPVINLGLGYAF